MIDESTDNPLDLNTSIDIRGSFNNGQTLPWDLKQAKLKKIRERIDQQSEVKKRKQQLQQQATGKEFYLQKVTNFLVASFFLNLAIEMVYVISLLHDYINGYFENRTYLFNDTIEGNNFCFLLFYCFRSLGYFISVRFFIEQIQTNVDSCETGRDRPENHHDGHHHERVLLLHRHAGDHQEGLPGLLDLLRSHPGAGHR